ncbi:MAG TPA: hypothetical protein VNG51_11355 [Ktedonobacteraceae bacterium]|nr:hypothetical protein [Ktedonobacteraceae bacterium]
MPDERVKEALYNAHQVHDLIAHGTPTKRKKLERENAETQEPDEYARQNTDKAVSASRYHAATDWIRESDLPFVWALDIELYGIENSVSPTTTWTWWRKNPYACRILFNKNNRREIWGALSIIPIEEATIYKLLSGEMKEQDVQADDVLAYEPGHEYACYVASVAILAEHRQSFGLLLHDVISFWCEHHPDIRISKLYAFALHEEEGTGIRLIRKLYFAPRYDISENAWELRLDRYNPSPTIQRFQECLRSKKTRRLGYSRTSLVDNGIIDAVGKKDESRIVSKAVYEAAKKENIAECVAIDEAIFGASTITPVSEQIAVRQGWWTQNYEVFHVLRVEEHVAGYVSTLPLPFEKIMNILQEVEHPRDITVKEIQAFQPGNPLDIYIVVMGVNPAYNNHQKRLLGGKLINGLTETFRGWGQRGIAIRAIYARSRLNDGIRILEHIGFKEMDFSPVSGKKIYCLNLEESNTSFAQVYRKAFEEYQSNVAGNVPREVEIQSTNKSTSEFSKAQREDILVCVELSWKTFQGLPQGIASVETRLGWIEKNPDLFYVVKHNGEVVGYTATIPMEPEKIQKILANEERMKDVRPDEVQEFKPGNPLHVYLMTMVTKPGISKAKKRAYGSTLIRGLIGTFIDLGKRGVTVETLYGRSESVDGIRALRHMGFTQIPTVTDMKNFVLKVDESDSPLIQEYKRALKESGQAVPEKVLLPAKSPDRNDRRFDRNKGEQNRTVTNANKQRRGLQQGEK